MTRFLEKNLMKIYERDFVDLTFRKKLSTYFTLNTSWSFAKRRELFNTSDFKIVNRDKIEDYTPNRPVNDEVNDTSFPEHNAFIGSVSLTARPWIKFTIRNGHQSEVPNSSPIISAHYRKGFKDILNSVSDFDQIELGFKHGFKIGIRGDVDVALRAGMFLSSDKMYFMDYKHFQGNQTPFITNDPVGSFRLLDYYKFSTSDKYFVAISTTDSQAIDFQFLSFGSPNSRKRITLPGYSTSKNYPEVDLRSMHPQIFRLKLLLLSRWQYLNYGFRIGIASYITANFSDNQLSVIR